MVLTPPYFPSSYQKSGNRKEVGRILLKGDNITLVRNLDDLNM